MNLSCLFYKYSSTGL